MSDQTDLQKAIQRIHQAALEEQPLHKFSKLAVKTAMTLVRAKNGRLRFLDHTKKLLVPGAILGALRETPELAIRRLGECIVGRAALSRKPVLVANVSGNRDFKRFKAEIEKRIKKAPPGQRKHLQTYYKKTLDKLKSELAVPIFIGDRLLGVLSVNAFRSGAFNQKHKKILARFAAEISVAVLNRRATIPEELRQIEQKMISVSDLEVVAQHIAEGLHRVVEGCIPNLFLYDQDAFDAGSCPFRFLASAGATQAERKLGAFKPRWSGLGGGGRGMEAIRKYRANKDPFVVVQDVVRDIRGSSTARAGGVKTTGCLPLVFRESVVGVLYLHFKKMHFFTYEEKRVLTLFATTAAIAVRNAKVLPSYRDLIGSGLLDQLQKFKPKGFPRRPKQRRSTSSLNARLWMAVDQVAQRLRTSRGEEEISKCIVDGVRRISSADLLGLPPRLPELFARFERHEGILYELPLYRDHLIHMFHVFYLGYLILNGWSRNDVPCFGKRKKRLTDDLLRTWFLAAIQHDIAYPVEMAQKWVPRLPQISLQLKAEIRTRFDWSPFLTMNASVDHIEGLVARFHEQLAPNQSAQKKALRFRRWMISRLLDGKDHGILGALTLLSLGWPAQIPEWAYDAALAVALHNYPRDFDGEIGQIPVSVFPLAFLLGYCDCLQEWGRGRRDESPVGDRVVDRFVRFDNLQVLRNETTATLAYNIQDRCRETVANWSTLDSSTQRGAIRKEKERISTMLDDQVAPLRKAWGGTSGRQRGFHRFSVNAVDEQEKEITSFSVI